MLLKPEDETRETRGLRIITLEPETLGNKEVRVTFILQSCSSRIHEDKEANKISHESNQQLDKINIRYNPWNCYTCKAYGDLKWLCIK